MDNRKVPVSITFRTRDIQPPLFVAGTFSDPQWVPHEMECAAGSDGENVFTQKLEVEPESKLQYKFRVGHGDWWLLNEDSPTVTDDAGNRNNLLEAPSIQDADLARDDNPEDSTKHDADNLGQQVQPIPRVEALKQSDEVDRSATSTPEFARVAAEVADSAAWVDPVTPEPEVSDEVAGEVGYRQMTSTPPKEAADTAAEVADAAEVVDTDEAEVPVESVPTAYRALLDVKDDNKGDSLDIAGYSNDPDPVPLFAHECAGLYEDDEIPGAVDAENPAESLNGGHGDTEEDFGDPTLERFPSTRDEIITTVRKVGTGLDVDQTAFEGAPPSPVVRSRNPSIVDVLGECQSSEDSPKSARGTRRLSLPRGSMSERSASAASLGSIAEGAEGEEIVQDAIQEEDAGQTAIQEEEASQDLIQEEEIGQDAIQEEEAGQTAIQEEEAGQTVIQEEEAGQTAIQEEEASQDIIQEEEVDQAVTHEDQTSRDAFQEEEASQAAIQEVGQNIIQKEETGQDAIQGEEVDQAVTHEGQISQDAINGQNAIEEEDADETRAENSKADDIAPVAEQTETAEEAIAAAKKAEGEITLAPTKPALRPVVTVPSPSVQPSNSLLTPVSDEDEAIVLKTGKDTDKSTEADQSGYLTPKRADTPQPEEPGSPREPAPNAAAPVAEDDVGTVASIAEAEPAIPMPPSPRIVISKVQDTPPEEELPQAASASSEDGQQDIETPPSTNGNTGTESLTETAATSSGVEDSQPGSLRKRSAPQPSPTDRAGTPGSIAETGMEAAKSGNWFTAFFRLIFVDWVGGFVSRLCGGQRKTLIATGVALVAMGAVWYWNLKTTEVRGD